MTREQRLARVAREQDGLIRDAQKILFKQLEPGGDWSKAINGTLKLLDGPRQRKIKRKYEKAESK